MEMPLTAQERGEDAESLEQHYFGSRLTGAPVHGSGLGFDREVRGYCISGLAIDPSTFEKVAQRSLALHVYL